MSSAHFETDWALPVDKRPTIPVPKPPKPAQSFLLRRVLEDLGRMSEEDRDRVREALEVVR
jgi:hypothetical protein